VALIDRQNQINVYINNKTPKSWATNFNKGLRIAKKLKKHFVVITNDIIFTDNWFEPLKQRDDAILIPACNINYLYNSADFKTYPCMQLNEYIGKEKYLDGIVQYHQSNFKFDDLKDSIAILTREIKELTSGHRYRMIGNAVTVDIVKLIAERL